MNVSRRFHIAVGLSLLAHALLFALPARKNVLEGSGPPPPPLTVRILPPEPLPEAPVETQPPQVAAVRPPAVARPRAPRPEPRPETPRVPETPPEMTVPSAPRTTPAPPPVDMLAMIEERREKRRAEEARRRPPPQAPAEDAATRNLRTLTGREGVGGVFQILRIGTRTAEFAFNGWRPEARAQWREVFEVDAGLGGNVERAIVRRMIQLIRTHYTGDFHWDSHRLGRVVTLSARPEDNAGLEDFLMVEFFGKPALKTP